MFRLWVVSQMSKLFDLLSKLRFQPVAKRALMRGDTIVEVTIVTAVLALVLAASYSLTSHALQDGINSNKRTEALSYAQQQVEYIKNMINNSQDLTPFESADGICIVDNSGSLQAKLWNDPSNICSHYNGSDVGVVVTFSFNVEPQQMFTVNAYWQSNNNPNEGANLYYKLPIITAQFNPPVINIDLSSSGADGFMPNNVWLYSSINPNGNLITSCQFQFSLNSDLTNSQTLSIPYTPGWTHIDKSGKTHTNECQGFNDATTHNVAGSALPVGTCKVDSFGFGSQGSIGACEKTDTQDGWPTFSGLQYSQVVYFKFCATTDGGPACTTPICHLHMANDSSGSGGKVSCP